MDKFRSHRCEIWWRRSRADSSLYRTVPRDGIRADDVSRKLARHRSLSWRAPLKIVRHGTARTHRKINVGGRERSARLAPVADLAAVLIRRARKLYAEDAIGLDLANTVYALDSTTIDLCLSLFPWADFRSTKAAVKMHTLLDLRGPIPGFIHISDGKMGDSLALDLIAPEAGAIYVMDRGYIDFKRLNTFHQAGAFFVTRAKRNMNYHRVYSHAVDKATGVGADQSITLDGFYTRKEYPQHLRRISFCDPETGKRFIFLTNNFVLAAAIVAALYKKRWSVELFFKWIKQNLRIKHFYGTSENAVKTQIWTAVSVYVLAAIIKKELALDVSLYTFLQILSVHSFEKIQLSRAFQELVGNNSSLLLSNQLNLFDI